MIRSKISVAISVTVAIIPLAASVSFVHALESATNTVTIGSPSLGFAPGNATIALFTQDGSGTAVDGNTSNDNYFPINTPGSFTGDPNGCVYTSADFGSGAGGCGHIEGNDPVTAPSGAGHDATGVITSNITFALADTGGAGGNMTISGGSDFSLCIDCDGDPTTGIVTLGQSVGQELDFGGIVGHSNVVIDNHAPGGAPITFTACADDTYEICDQTLKMDIPWSLSMDQNMLEAPGGEFLSASSGVFTYEVQKNDKTIHEAYIFDAPPCIGLGIGQEESCWPGFGSFDLPGFDMSHQSPMLGNGKNNFPGLW